MFRKKILKPTSMIACFLMLWISFPHNGATAENEENMLNKVKLLIQQGDYDGAIDILGKLIEKIKTIKEQNKNLAEAYYLLAKTYDKVGLEDKVDENLRMAYTCYPNLSYPESNIAFKARADKVKNDVQAQLKPESQKQTILEKEPESPPQPKVQKKKFPWLLVAGGIAVLGLAAVLLLGKKESTTTTETGDYDTTVLKIEWVEIPGGGFIMGDNFGDGESNEKPPHEVYLDTYAISKHEVTFSQYDAFCDDTSLPKPIDEGWGRGTRPAIHISWNDAQAFCTWLSQKCAKSIYLPSEAQWERAARYLDNFHFPWGTNEPNCNLANYSACNLQMTQPVGSYPAGATPLGILDLAGNVLEWCGDWFDESYYSQSPYSNPPGPSSGPGRVLRGGSFDHPMYFLRTTCRLQDAPTSASKNYGFRICKTPT